MTDPAAAPGAAETDAATALFAPVPPPDGLVWQAARDYQEQLTKPLGALGRLEDLGCWLAACQGQCPPRDFERARIVVFVGDHGVVQHGVSAYPAEVTVQMVHNFLAGGAAVNVVAGIAGASVRVLDIAVDAGDEAGFPPAVTAHKIRRSSGSIDREDALTAEQTRAAIAAGKAVADEEVDAGADLLICGDMGIGNTTPATALVGAITGREPVALVGRGTGIDDDGWMRKTAAVRDAMWRARGLAADPARLLAVAGGADFAAMAGFLAQAATRRTPVILDGLNSTAAALVAQVLAPGAHRWWVAGHRSTEPAHTAALERLGLTPLIDLGMHLGEGSGAAAALPILRAAAATMSDMATFAGAGISTAVGDEVTEPVPAPEFPAP